MGEKRNAYRILVGKPEGKRPLGKLRRRWNDNIKIDLREIGLTSPTSGGRSVGIVRGRTKALEFFFREIGLGGVD
jgi:hypothetical protein